MSAESAVTARPIGLTGDLMKCRNFIYSAGLLYAPEWPMGTMLSPEELVRRARERCKHHRQPGVGGVCRECVLAELEQAPGDVGSFVSGWRQPS